MQTTDSYSGCTVIIDHSLLNKQAKHTVGVTVLEKAKDYCETFYKIDKGNGAEAKYDLGGNR